MSYSDLKKLKAQQSDSYKKQFSPHIVVGESLYALAVYHQLVQWHGENAVKLICKKEDVSKEDFLLRGPSQLRGEANLKAVEAFNPELEIKEKNQVAVFLKEGSFREFGGRSKGEPMLWGEEFYSQKAYDINLEQIFTVLDDQEFFQGINDKRLRIEIEKLQPETYTDLVDQNNWSLSCANGELWQCKNLYWARSANDFLHLHGCKNDLSSDFIQFCESTKGPSSLLIKWQFEKPVSDMTETLFIPQSYTHEWGHYIGEFEKQGEGQSIDFVTFVDPDQTGEEELSKKIRLLKKNLEKIFPSTKKISGQEFIQLTADTPCQKIDDALFNKVKPECGNLLFIGHNAPLNQVDHPENFFEDSVFASTHLARALLNWREFLQQNRSNS